jgi:hypothetical protein
VDAAGLRPEEERRFEERTGLYEASALLRLAVLDQHNLDPARLGITAGLLDERLSSR